jgi:hypothetical protein
MTPPSQPGSEPVLFRFLGQEEVSRDRPKARFVDVTMGRDRRDPRRPRPKFLQRRWIHPFCQRTTSDRPSNVDDVAYQPWYPDRGRKIGENGVNPLEFSQHSPKMWIGITCPCGLIQTSERNGPSLDSTMVELGPDDRKAIPELGKDKVLQLTGVVRTVRFSNNLYPLPWFRDLPKPALYMI